MWNQSFLIVVNNITIELLVDADIDVRTLKNKIKT